MSRYIYATGFKTREAAEDGLESLYASAEVSEGERPRIEPYEAWAKPQPGQPLATVRRFCITLLDAY